MPYPYGGSRREASKGRTTFFQSDSTQQGVPVAARPMSLEAYAARNHALVSPRGTTTGVLDRILVDFGLKWRIAPLVATYLAVPAGLAASDLIATAPRRVAEQIAANAAIAITPGTAAPPPAPPSPGSAPSRPTRRLPK